MVILNIPKITADVNVFQNRINILLIFNNNYRLFLGIMTIIFFNGARIESVKLITLTNVAFLSTYVTADPNISNPPEIDIYIKGIVISIYNINFILL